MRSGPYQAPSLLSLAPLGPHQPARSLAGETEGSAGRRVMIGSTEHKQGAHTQRSRRMFSALNGKADGLASLLPAFVLLASRDSKIPPHTRHTLAATRSLPQSLPARGYAALCALGGGTTLLGHTCLHVDSGGLYTQEAHADNARARHGEWVATSEKQPHRASAARVGTTRIAHSPWTASW